MNSRTLKMIQLVVPKKSEGTPKAGIQYQEKGAHLHRLLRVPNKKLERLLQKVSDIRLRYCINYKGIIYKRRFEGHSKRNKKGKLIGL
ncbi:unnamed protein product [Acanthoscelides obtectus]|uniref:Uncharacterized protein n=1 Tax=Acanthoscelides obtectus TaxID=200917 RepID=A0A9P0M1U1_ACAOB|nr:unnamed protein product [Acanthoscelides obtectus]CAK1650380.1 hypothetical protein AOBTE_LOCUS16753 [Acanthoscelides obtectus]